jgi:hypothetical protein
MNFRKYVGKYVKVDLINSNIYYKGLVLSDTTEHCLELKDIHDKNISLKEESILNIREIKDG